MMRLLKTILVFLFSKINNMIWHLRDLRKLLNKILQNQLTITIKLLRFITTNFMMKVFQSIIKLWDLILMMLVLCSTEEILILLSEKLISLIKILIVPSNLCLPMLNFITAKVWPTKILNNFRKLFKCLKKLFK